MNHDLDTLRLDGRVAIVTGGAKGLGLASGRLLAGRGASVVLVDRDEAAAETAVKELVEEDLNVSQAVADVTDSAACQAAVQQAVDRYGRLDILVNSAGIPGKNGCVWELSSEEWGSVIDVNLTGTFNMCRSAVPAMIDKWGRIVNIASIAGKEGNPTASHYSASKAAIIALTKSLGKELAEREVLVNAITPAVIETDMSYEVSKEHLAYMLERIPMKRMGQAQEVARLVCFLCSEQTSFSTGAVFDISGGRATY